MKEIGNLIAVDPINDAYYSSGAIPARIGMEALAAAGPGLTTNLGKLGTAINVLDKANDIVNGVQGLNNVVVGINNARQNGLNLQTGMQIVGGAAGAAGGIASISDVAKGARAIQPKVAGSPPPAKMAAGGNPGTVHADASNAKLPRFEGPKPTYSVNPAHVSGTLRKGKTPLPADAESVFHRAVPDDPVNPRNWYGQNAKGQIYRFSGGNDGTAHFSGIDGVGDGIRNITKYARQRLKELP
jgi:hypothetical protein